MGIILAILIFSAIVLFHEYGHFLVAKKCDVQVNEFMIGLGPKLVGIQRGETLFSIHLLPFGGACVMEGEESGSDNPRAFHKKSAWQRLAIAFAGPFFNMILAFVLSVILLAMIGVDKPVIANVLEDYPAAEAGLEAGDVITKINHKSIHFYREVSLYLLLHGDETLTVTYERDGETYTTVITPKLDEESGNYYMGVQFSGTYEKVGVVETISAGFHYVEYYIWYTVESLKMIFTGSVSVNDMSGPVGIVQTIGETYTESKASGGWYYVIVNMLNISVLLSANLGIMNLLPIPGLDGGRILFNIIEIIRRKQIPADKEGFVHMIGIAVLMLLMFVILFNDIRKIIFGI